MYQLNFETVPSKSEKEMILINNFAYQYNQKYKDREYWRVLYCKWLGPRNSLNLWPTV